MAKVYLIGTSHSELSGRKKLKAKLDEIKPDIVLIEGDAEEDKFMIEYSNTYRKFLEDELVKQNVDYRLRELVLEEERSITHGTDVPKEYAASNQKKFMYLGDSYHNVSITKQEIRSQVRSHVKNTKKIGYDNYLELFINPLQQEIKERWEHLKEVEGTPEESVFALETIDFVNSGLGLDKGIGHRDIQMKDTLRDVISINTQRIIATSTGLAHILDDPQNRNLYGLIRDLNPQRVFLYD